MPGDPERMPPRPPAGTSPDAFLVAKTGQVKEIARAKGLLATGAKNRMVSARLDEALIAAAKQRTGITSDTELIEIAIASLAVGDDFGEWLLAQEGRLDPEFRLEL